MLKGSLKLKKKAKATTTKPTNQYDTKNLEEFH